MATDNKISFIIPTYNRLNSLTKTVDSIIKQTHKTYEIIIVDDGSTDGTVKKIQQYADIRILKTQGRRGPSYARNLAILQSKGHYLWFLDSDVILPDENIVSRTLAMFQSNKKIGSLGGEIVPLEGNVDRAYGRKLLWDGRNKRIEAYKNTTLIECDYLATCNCLTKKEYTEKLKGFDEQFVFGAEDMDFGTRLQHLGLNNYVWHGASVLHYHSQTGRYEDETIRYHHTRVQFIKKHFSRLRFGLVFTVDIFRFITFNIQLLPKLIFMKLKNLPVKKQNILGGWYRVKPYFVIR